jgi:hypothetical protein
MTSWSGRLDRESASGALGRQLFVGVLGGVQPEEQTSLRHALRGSGALRVEPAPPLHGARVN